MEILFAVVLLVSFLVGVFYGSRNAAAESRVLRRTLEKVEESNDTLRATNLQLLNTILQMRSSGLSGPPVDEEWGSYVMPEGEDE